MKRTFACLIALIFFATSAALAFTGSGYPKWDGSTAAENAFAAAFDGEAIRLALDSSREYSNIADGSVQACYFAFDEKEENYLELYLLLPEDVQSGDVLNAASKQAFSLTLYEVSKDTETMYYAGFAGGAAYSASAELEIRIVEAHSDGAQLVVSGAIDANLAGVSNPAAQLSVKDAQFHFALPLVTITNDNAQAPNASGAPSAPGFTLPPYYAEA